MTESLLNIRTVDTIVTKAKKKEMWIHLRYTIKVILIPNLIILFLLSCIEQEETND